MEKSKMLVCRVGIVLMGLLAAVAFAVDTDTDGMSDGYELFFGLNHTNASDALLDTDGDSVTNLTESILWTDPLFADTDRDGWADSIDANPLSRAVFLWSNPKFATGDSYLYTGPLWWNHAFRVGGDWTTNGWEAGNGLSNNTGSLNIQVIRSLLTNDVVLDVELFDSTNASLYAALCDSNQAVIVSDLYGNIVTGSQEVVIRRLSIPFSSYSNASILRLWRGTGDITVYSSLMYIDEDGDGVDADQELQAGTSDSDADSDDDGLNDFAELFLTDTDPLDADSDDDGYDDQAEVIAESDPNDAQSIPAYAVWFTLPFTETFEERSAGDLDGQHGWEVNDGGTATVQSNTVFNGEQALSVTDASVSHTFTDAQTNVWVSYRLKAVPGSEPQDLPADMAVVFYVNADSFLCAYSNQTPVTLPVTVSNDWNRFDIHSDFSSKRWNMRFNRELVVSDFPFYGSPDAFSILRVDGNGTYMDDVQVVFENPDRDNDGYTNDEETEEGSDPDDPQSLPDDVLIELEQTSLSIPEGGSVQLGVRLSAAPRNASPVLVTLISGDSDITVQEGVSLTFTTSNWMTAQQVSLFAAQDADWLDGTAVVRCYSTGRESIEIQVTEEDDEFDPDYSTPWAEPFEELTAGNLNDQRGWAVTGEGTALVQSNIVFAGNQAAAIADASASHEFEDGQTNVWISYRLKAVPGNGPESIPDDMAVVFWVNSDSYLCVYSNQTAVTLPVKVSEDWNRFEFYCDFSSKHWNLRLNRELVVSDFPFYGSPDVFSVIRMDGKCDGTYMDDVQVVLENPDRDNDGYTNDEETESGSNPDDAGSIPVSEVIVSGVVSYDGSQTGAIHVIATTVSNGWNSAANDQLVAPGAYSIANVPVLSNVWIKAWLDSDASGVCDPWEAKGTIESPLYLSWSKSGVDLILDDPPDSDSDGLPDWWEYTYLGGISFDGSDDPDGDGLVNSNEMAYLTDPQDADTDEDGLGDGWMVTNGFSPLQISYEHLAGCWRFDETNGVVAADSSENSNAATVDGAAWGSGWLNGGLVFDGLDDSVTVANSPEYKPENFTIMLRVRLDALYGNTTVSGAVDGVMTLLSQKGTGAAPAIELRKTETHALEFEISDGTNSTVVRSSDDFFVTDRWIQIMAVYDGTNASLHADGVPVDSASAVSSVSYSITEGLALGAPASGLSGGYLNGALDDIVMFDRAFSASELNGLTFAVSDTDNDGLSNREEQQHGTDPNDADSDDDGLADSEEVRFGCDPLNTDSDGDNLTDAEEVRIHHTNPNAMDSDSDGLSDYDEVITHGTDPNDADSDDDGLTDGEEINTHSTDPLDADDDDDGVLDGDEANVGLDPREPEVDNDADGLSNVDEVYLFATDPLDDDSDGDGTNDLYTVETQDGTNTVYQWGYWTNSGGALVGTTNGRARAEYEFTITEADVYQIGIQVSNAWPNALSNAEFNVQMLVDGIPAEMIHVDVEAGTNAWGYALTPYLTPATHVIRLAWMAEKETNERIRIEAVALQRIDAATNANGRQEWVNTLLSNGIDSDADGLADLAELDQYGTEPVNPDTDGDTLSDAEELTIFGLNPLLADSDTNGVPDAVLLQTRNGSDTAERWGQWYDHSRDESIAESEIKAIWGGTSVFYDFNVQTAGMYRVGFQVRNHIRDPKDNYSFRFQTSFNYHEEDVIEVYADTDRGNAVYFTTPWLTPGTHRVGFEWINDSWQTRRRLDLLVQEVRFYAVNGGTNDWMGEALTAAGDSDGDGLDDYDEVNLYGTSPTIADSDGDGVNDGDEVTIGTDPNDTDSDDDGMDDYTELYIAYSNPTHADFGAITTNLTIYGSEATTNRTGTWTESGNSIYARERNGFLEYNFVVSSIGHYALKIYGHQRNALTSRRYFDLRLYVDSLYTGKQWLDGPHGSNDANVIFFLPRIDAGSHTVRLDWENIRPNTFLQVDKLELLSIEGAWITNRLNNIAEPETVPGTSLISPVCIEGMGWYQEMLSIDSSYVPPENTNYLPVIQQGIRNDWYANVRLSPTNRTSVDVMEENGQKAWSNTVQWTEFNLNDAPTNLMMIRKNDALLLNSHPTNQTTGAVELEIIGVTNYSTTADAPVAHAFTNAGWFTVEGIYEGSVTNFVAVKVVEGTFPTNPICVVRRERTWDCPGLPSEAVIEYDDRLTLNEEILPEGGRRFTLRTDQPEPLTVLARLGEGGPVLDKTTVQPVNGDSGAYWKTVQSFPDGSRMAMVNLHMGNVPDDLLIKLNIVVGGVTFEDGTTQMWLDADDFDENGNCTYYLMQGAGLQTSTCHSTTVYQGEDQETAVKIESL